MPWMQWSYGQGFATPESYYLGPSPPQLHLQRDPVEATQKLTPEIEISRNRWSPVISPYVWRVWMRMGDPEPSLNVCHF